MFLKALIKDADDQKITLLAKAILEDEIYHLVDEEGHSKLHDDHGGYPTDEAFLSAIEESLKALSANDWLYIEMESNEKDGDNEEEHPTKLMKAIEDISGEFVYVNSGANTSHGTYPAFAIVRNEEGQYRCRVQEVMDNTWEAVIGRKSNADAKLSAEKVDEALEKSEKWIDAFIAHKTATAFKA